MMDLMTGLENFKLQHDSNSQTENIGMLFDVLLRNNSYATKAAMSLHGAS